MTTFRAPAFQHWMARLALAAVLLLALAPTLSRAAAIAAPQALGAMCTADGLAPAAVPANAAWPADPAGDSSDAACDYCPLLAQVTPFSAVSLPMPSLHAAPPRLHDAVAWPYAARAQAGLGARGPPPHA
ncbi:DUF2946 family protein [Thermomonas mangrovi]|uniref:DUF2946 family protein n=1 Tax=Thermomonas mangrovi TaxID=2993316 RepID=UPI0023082CDB